MNRLYSSLALVAFLVAAISPIAVSAETYSKSKDMSSSHPVHHTMKHRRHHRKHHRHVKSVLHKSM